MDHKLSASVPITGIRPDKFKVGVLLEAGSGDNRFTKMVDVRYRVVWGDRKRIARLIPDRKPC